MFCSLTLCKKPSQVVTLFHSNSSIAHLEIVDISGSCKGLGYDPGEESDTCTIPRGSGLTHIKIEGQRFACECDWAAGHVARDKDTGKYQYVRQWTEAWFLADPETCDASHLPLTADDDVNTSALMSSPSYKSYIEWNDAPEKKPAYFIYKMQCLSHKHAVIDAENNQVEIRLKCFYPMDIYTTMKKAKDGDVKPLQLPKEREYDRCVVRYFQGNEVVVVVRLPSKGDYIVDVCGYAHGICEDVQHASGQFIVGYRVRGLSDVPCALFPERKGDIYGASWDLQLAGVNVIQPSQPVIESQSGKATIELDRGESDRSLIFKYYHESDPSTDLEEYVYPESIGNKVRLNLSCPKAGMYACVIYCKFDDEDETNNTHSFAGQFVISSPRADTQVLAYPSDSNGLWGPDDFIHKLGIQMSKSMTMSTIHTDNNGEACIGFIVPKAVTYSHRLTTMKGEDIETHLCTPKLQLRQMDQDVLTFKSDAQISDTTD
ncbi:uncharacterized protein [Amphiura filiformis]|uniref:uncharacterized protein n=1 Tax=Amphiura filiformis TaxID=82378 RepID=UPI003B224EC4